MKISIRNKLFITINLVLITLFFLKYLVTIENIEKQTYQSFQSTNETIYKFLTSNIKESIYLQDIEASRVMLHSIENKNIKNIFIFDNNYKLLIQKNEKIDDKVDEINIKNILKNSKTGLIRYKNSDYYVSKFSVLDITLAYMVISIDLTTFEKQIERSKQNLYEDSLIFGFFSMILIYFLSRFITRPIEQIVRTLKKTKSSTTLTFNINTQDEFSFLATAIAHAHNNLANVNILLEEEVTKKTKELQTLNEELENRVKIEVEKNYNQTQQMLQQSRLAQMGELLSMIAHQWRQPLSSMSSVIYNIQLKRVSGKYNFDKEEDRKEYFDFTDKKLDKVNYFIEHLSTTIDDFRNFFKPNNDKKSVNLTLPIEKTLQIIGCSLSNYNIEVKMNFLNNDPLLLYQNEIMQVILNILKNAEDNFREREIQNPIISITTDKKQDEYSISIADNGGGIDEDIIESIFNPYFSTKNEKDGTGIGLYMSKIMIEEHHNGLLQVKNTEDGVEFKIILKKE